GQNGILTPTPKRTVRWSVDCVFADWPRCGLRGRTLKCTLPCPVLRQNTVSSQNGMSICAVLVRRVGGGQVRQTEWPGAGLEQKTTRRFNDAIHGDREGEQGV